MSANKTTLAELLAADRAAQTAVVIPDGGPSLSHGELRGQIGSLAESLGQGGIRAGDTVSIVLPNCLEYLGVFLAVTWRRAIAAPLNPAYKVDEFRFYMADAGACAVIVPP